MSDNLTVFGVDYTNVAGIKAHATSDSSLMAYIRPQGSTSITQNGTVDVTQYAQAVVSVSAEDSTLIVNLSYNDSTDMWEPDKTFAEIQAAYTAGKTIAFECESGFRLCDGWYSSEYNQVEYAVYDDGPAMFSMKLRPYVLNSSGITEQESHPVFDASRADAVESDVAQGKMFVNSTGYHEGTATTPTPSLQSKTATPTESQQTVTPDSGYDGLSDVTVDAISGTYVGSQVPRVTLSGDVDVTPSETRTLAMADGEYLEGGNLYISAIPSTYVGSGITRRSSTDLTASGATVSVPAGYYQSQASKAVASGTAGTPTATKGTVSNHSVSVTPSVTNSTGYITGGMKTGTAVTVSASELVSGTLSITSSGTKDVTNYASASVAAGSVSPSATKDAVSNHSIAVHPYADTSAGFVGSGRYSGSAVTVSASELVSGNLAITDNTASTDVTNYATVSVAIPFVTYYTSSSTPTSSQGSDGDVWLVTA